VRFLGVKKDQKGLKNQDKARRDRQRANNSMNTNEKYDLIEGEIRARVRNKIIIELFLEGVGRLRVLFVCRARECLASRIQLNFVCVSVTSTRVLLFF